MGNLDFSNSPLFSWYCVLLLISSVAMLGVSGAAGASTGSRIANLLFGAGFMIYALYLMFVFEGVHYIMFFKAFILPAMLIVGALKSAGDKRRTAGQSGPVRPMMDYGNPMQGQPNAYAPANPYGQPPVEGQPQFQPQPGFPQQSASAADAPTQAVPAPQWGAPQTGAPQQQPFPPQS